MLYRQGDIFIERVPSLPSEAVRLKHVILAEGEATGHHHRMESNDTAFLFDLGSQTYLQVISDRARLIHEEHGTIILKRGTYRYWRQREYDPTAQAWPSS